MRIVHLLHEFPDPQTSGIRCDMRRRLDAFRSLGHEVFAIAWASVGAGEMPSQAEQAAFSSQVDHFALIPIGGDFASRARRIWNMRRHPSYIAARIPEAAQLATLIERIRAFAPDLVWLEGVHPSWLALELKRKIGAPLAYRSHNIEHLYVAEQARLASTWRRKLALSAGAWGLEHAERQLHVEADHVFDISADDLKVWRKLGFSNNSWLAPQHDRAIFATKDAPEGGRDIDLLYLGSLSSPNNQAGLAWYAQEIHPRIIAEIPGASVVVAGRKPPADLRARLEAAGIRVVADPPDAAALYARSRALLNPILHGSGVNIKTVDMFASGQAVVTTAKGARGLPADVVAELHVADEPTAFAAAAIAAVRKSAQPGDRQALIERVFGEAAVAAALARSVPAKVTA